MDPVKKKALRDQLLSIMERLLHDHRTTELAQSINELTRIVIEILDNMLENGSVEDGGSQ